MSQSNDVVPTSNLANDPAWREIFDALTKGVLVTNLQGCVIFGNARAAAILSVPAQKVAGVLISDLVPASAQPVAHCIRTGKPRLNCWIGSNNEPFIADITPFGRNDKILGAVCTFEEGHLFERRARELEAYKFLERQLAAVFNSSPSGIWILDPGGKVLDINPAAEKLVDVKASKVVGRNVRDLVSEGVLDQAATPRVLSTKREIKSLLYIPRTQKYILTKATPAFDESGKISLVVTHDHDMTSLNLLQEQLEQSRMEMRRIKDKLAELSSLELIRGEIIAESETMQHVLRVALKLASMQASSILITGESGTGKGLLAKFIHKSSRRKGKPFIQLNCAALPESLLEAELFGYEKGAFTGARDQGKIGLFELAHEGTLFLDEIGDLPLAVQAKLLKCLDEGEVMHIGGLRPIKVDCIILSATNRDLKELVRKREFREDLYYRLSTFNLVIRPLRERPEDVIALITHFLKKFSSDYDLHRRLSPQGYRILQSHDFPGNVRELKNILKNAVVMSEEECADSCIMDYLSAEAPQTKVTFGKRGDPRRVHLTEEVRKTEMELFKKSVEHCKSTREMATNLGISQSTVVRKLKRYGMSIPK